MLLHADAKLTRRIDLIGHRLNLGELLQVPRPPRPKVEFGPSVLRSKDRYGEFTFIQR